MNSTLTHAIELKQQIIEDVLDAEGEPAIALETFSAAKLTNAPQNDTYYRNVLVDRFLLEGDIGGRSPLRWFSENHPELTESDRELIELWQHGFFGLFAIEQQTPNELKLLNWLTNKSYPVQITDTQFQSMTRLKEGEVVITQIAPLDAANWMIVSEWSTLGKLGKPKLAVAIGSFKQHYKPYLYSDAPDLLDEAWRSVQQHHQTFVEFFGGDEVTLPGYQLSKKLAEYQEQLTQKSFAAAGLDSSKSLTELAEDAGVSEEEIAIAVEEMGVEEKLVKQALNGKSGQAAAKMVAPKIELPDHLKKAEQVTIFSDPRWGQAFLSTYTRFKSLLEAEDWQQVDGAENLVKNYLQNAEVNTLIWHRLSEQYPKQIESILKVVTNNPSFNLQGDLDTTLAAYNKPIEPELPETASVPIHLHELFQAAIAEVSKPAAKNKTTKKKVSAGFGR